MTPWLYGVGGSLVAGALLGWTVRDWKSDADLLASERAVQAAYEAKAEAEAAASLRYEELARSIRAAEHTDRLEIREIFRDVEVPTNCAVPDDAVSVLDNAIQRANDAASGESGEPLPPASEGSEPID